MKLLRLKTAFVLAVVGILAFSFYIFISEQPRSNLNINRPSFEIFDLSSQRFLNLNPNWSRPNVRIVKDRFNQKESDRSKIDNRLVEEQRPKGKLGCRLPKLETYSPAIKPFIQEPKPLECSTVEKNWVYVRNSTFYIDPEAVARHGGEINCSYSNYWRISDHEVESKTKENFQSGSKLEGDFFKVECQAKDNATYKNVHAAIVPSKEALRRVKEKSMPPKALDLNVYMLGFDSMSRLAIIRRLPKTYEYLTETMGAIVLEGHNILGDGTPRALVPTLTGKTEYELPLTRSGRHGANFVDVYPLIWNDYREAGYVTLYGEDAATLGTFTQRFRGFDKQPTDHYMRTFYVMAEPEISTQKKNCWGSEEHHVTHFRYVEQFWNAYPFDVRKFAFQFHSVYSHDDMNLINVADDFMVQHLKFFVDNGHFNDTIIIFMTDHGNRFAQLRETQQGLLEERLPFFSFAFPPWFKKKYPETMQVFKANIHRLTTPRDIHPTLKEILHFDPKPKMGDLKSRSLSLFHEIPIERTCADADIGPHWCTCLDWTAVPLNDPMVQFIADSLIDVINKETELERKLCSKLKLNKIVKALKYVPTTGVLIYKEALDLDGTPDLSRSNETQVEYYQLDVWTLPGDAHYEASVALDKKSNELSIDLDAVSHVNKFGDLPHCIFDKDYFLIKWCVCYDKI